MNTQKLEEQPSVLHQLIFTEKNELVSYVKHI